ncbi:hypothetical protein [Desulfonatronospira sp.]|uniref:hypothetical protein n=1 Tax=Desulfonatronospira sp. TaxID=1962951 RepID=UPI0025C12F23|nr:hypothetical protein [Desulfonatronospira sp.]
MNAALSDVLKMLITIKNVTDYYFWHAIFYDISCGVEIQQDVRSREWPAKAEKEFM